MNLMKLVVSFLAASVLAGCATKIGTPWRDDVLARPDQTPIASDAEQARLSYIASAMMESDDRAKLNAEMAGRTAKSGWGAFEASTFAQMTTDAAVGDLGSQLGSSVGLATYAGAAILGEIFDGSMDRASQIWLPAVVSGRRIQTKREAQAAADQVMFDKIMDIAKQMGWSATCLTRCPGENQIIVMKRPTNQANPGYIHWPEEVVFHTSRGEMEAVPANHPIRAVLGKDVAWQSPLGNMAYIEIYSGAKHDENGRVRVLTAKNSNFQYPDITETLTGTHLGRDLNRLLHSDGLSMYGNATTFPKILVFNGEISSFVVNSKTRMIDKRVVEPNLLLRLHH